MKRQTRFCRLFTVCLFVASVNVVTNRKLTSCNAFLHRNSWSLYTAGSYRTTIRVSTRSCARTCSFRGVSPFLPRGIGEPVGKVWQTGCRNYCCHRAKPCGILRPMHAGQSGCYRNRNAIGRDERQYFGVRPARRNPQLFFRPGLALSRRLVRAGAGSPV